MVEAFTANEAHTVHSTLADPRSVSLVIPAYNEEGRLCKALDAYVPMLENLGVNFEVIVIADGKDNTPRVVEPFRSRGVICYTFPRKLGRGGAVFEGFRRARYSIIAFADADGSIPASDARTILSLVLSGRPVAIASRRLLPEMVEIPEAAHRRLIGLVWHTLVRVLLSVPVKDAQCGFKAFRSEIVRNVILTRVTITNRTFEVDMLYHIVSAGYHIEEVPVRYAHDFDTRMPITKAIPIMLLSLIGIFVFNVVLSGTVTPPKLVRDLNRRFSTT